MSHPHTNAIEVILTVEEGAVIPEYATHGAAGADVRACLKEPRTLPPGTTMLIPTGLRMAIPEGYEIQVRPRSGMALKNGITVLNTPGTIDCDYRGELGVILINHSKENFTVTSGMRIAQLILAPVTRAHFITQNQLAETARGTGGFGHTGAH